MIKKQMSHNFDKYGVTECYESIFNDTKVSVLLEGIHMELTSFFPLKLLLSLIIKVAGAMSFRKKDLIMKKVRWIFI